MSTFTFFWKDGKREVFEGSSPADALNKVGYGHGALRALDFWAHGDDDEYIWNKDKHSWVKKVE